MRHLAGYTVQRMLSCPFRIVVFSVFSYVCRISHRFFTVFCRLSICTCQLRLPFVFQLRAGVRGGWGGLVDLVVVWCGAVRYIGGDGGDDDVHANAAAVLCFSCCFVHWRGGARAAFRIGLNFPGSFVPTLDFSHVASLDFHVYVFDLRAGVGSGGDGGRDDVHANAAYMHGIFFGSVHWWGGGRLMMSMLSGMMLIAFAEDNHGDDDTYGDNNDNDNVAARCPYCYVTF